MRPTTADTIYKKPRSNGSCGSVPFGKDAQTIKQRIQI